MKPVYAACSLPDTFAFPEDSPRGRLLAEAILPACREANIPLSLMIGVRRQVNPALRLAGDASGGGSSSTGSAATGVPGESLPGQPPEPRESARALRLRAQVPNLMPFGCWWFLNNPSMVEEMTRERIEMLGSELYPAAFRRRVLEQLIYKWRNTRRTLAPILTQTYTTMAEDGRAVTRADIERDVTRMFRGNFLQFAPSAAAGR